MVYVPAGVPPGGPLPGTGVTIPPPQEAQSAARRSAEHDKRRLRARPCILRRFTKPTQKRMQAKRAAQFQRRNLGRTRNCGHVKKPERCVVVTMTLAVDAWLPSKVTEDGTTVQDAPVGMPEQVNVTTLLNPPVGVSVTVKLADCPALIVSPVGLTEALKSALFPIGGATDCKV